jgi:membrane protein YdbS with pleckstrin-like domain
MKARLLAILNFTLGLLLYPVAFITILWIALTGRSWWFVGAVILIVLLLDRSWWIIVRYWFNSFKQK